MTGRLLKPSSPAAVHAKELSLLIAERAGLLAAIRSAFAPSGWLPGAIGRRESPFAGTSVVNWTTTEWS